MLTALVIAYLAGVFTVLICGALVLIPVPHEEESDDSDTVRNVAQIAAHPLPSVPKREAIRADRLRQRNNRMA